MQDQPWPLFDLAVRTPRLELRPPRESDMYALVHLAGEGIHDPSSMPFLVPWTDLPSPRRERESLQFYWRCWAEWSAERWRLPLVAVADGVVVGTQDLAADDFVTRRVVETGSWLGAAHQGRGLGKEMRSAVLHLAFVGLDATRALTGAWHDNGASLGVTRALGYEPNGDQVRLRRGRPALELEFKMDRAGFDRIRRSDIVVDNLDPCLPLFGLADEASTGP
jgi:RimJ/RimL family protein N-acetyltransferase